MENILIGCSGWFYPHWSGFFYPKEIPMREWFSYYASLFNTVELNSTFYSFPSVKRAERWYNESPKSFKYSIKMNRTITHTKRMVEVDDEMNKFYDAVSHLKEKLSSVLIQLPPSFKYTKENLNRISSSLRSETKEFFEFRHRSWYTPEALNELRRMEIEIVAISFKDLPFFLPEQDDVYIRMHGNIYGYATDYSEKTLMELATTLIDKNYRVTYVYFNNDYNGYAPKNALSLKKLLEKSY
ncbi:MAG: DUF72 domain-containing protein [Thermoplasmatales archaeon]